MKWRPFVQPGGVAMRIDMDEADRTVGPECLQDRVGSRVVAADGQG